MTSLLEWMDPAIWALFAFSAGLLALGAPGDRRALRTAGATLLVLGALALLAALAVPALLPARSSVLRPDGSTDDPRVLSALVAALAAIAATLPAWRAQRGTALAAFGAAVPGIVAAGLAGSLAFFAGLRAPMGLAAIALGALAIATAVAFAFRRPAGGFGLLVMAVATGALVICGVISVHGPRAVGFSVTEDTPADTLGMNVSLMRVDAPARNLRIMTLALRGPHDSLAVQPQLQGEEGRDWRSVAAGPLLSGPIAIPLTLREQRTHAHEIQWVGKGESLKAGDASIRFTGFRIEHTDSIRMFADLEVTTASGTEKVSPGVIASRQGEIPFAASAKGLGPVVVARLDPDNHRVGLVLPTAPGTTTKHELALELRLRPALRWAWAAAALALVGYALVLLPVRDSRRRA